MYNFGLKQPIAEDYRTIERGGKQAKRRFS